MIKKRYNITGFDCANCARKTEAHLNKDSRISTARLDFSGNKLYLSFRDKEMSIDEIKKLIAEVETDPIDISDSGDEIKKKRILTKDLIFLLGKVLFGVVIIILSFTAFHKGGTNYFAINVSLYALAVILLTYDIVWKVIKHVIHKENPIDEYLLITIAVLGSFVIGIYEGSKDNFVGAEYIHELMESVMVVALFQVGRVIEGIATNKSKEAIMSAVDLRIETAHLVIDNEIRNVKPESLKVNDVVKVTTGELIPIDGEIVDGEGLIDTSSLTGEFVPVRVTKESLVFSGCTLKSGTISVRATKEYKESTVSKIMEMISNSGENKSKADKFITKFARWYTPIVFIASILFAVIGGAITKEWPTYALNGLKMLVVACPCAIVISVPMAYFSAIGLASKNGIVIKGTNYLDELTKMKKLITDKTGTLTHGSFTVKKIVTNKTSEQEFLSYLYAAECLSTHPIGKAICHGKDLKKLAAEQTNFNEIAGLGVESTYNKKHILAGSIRLMSKNNIDVPISEDYGTTIYCAVNKNYIGYVVLSDEIKEDAEPMVSLLHNEGVEIVLLTGDKENNTKAICNKLNIDRWHSELLPEQKKELLKEEMSKDGKYSTAYIGDGINDAASIRLSDIGIAMGGIGSDVAVENADIVIMNDDPAKVWDALKISKMARNTAIFNIVSALFIKIGIEIITIVSTITKAFDMPMVVAVIADTGLTVLLVINSLLLLYRKVKRKNIR